MKVQASFRAPPVVETVLGVHFRPIAAWSPAHAGEFWHRYLGKDWPTVGTDNPLAHQEEILDETGLWKSGLPNIEIGREAPRPRMQFSTASGDRMLQIQDSWFLYNWQKGGKNYPTYKTLKPEFFEKYDAFIEYLTENGFPTPNPHMWEVTYVNRLPIGGVWNNVSDWEKLIPSILGPSSHLSVGNLESFNENWTVRLSDNSGRLRVNIRHIKFGPNKTEALDFRLVARGPFSGEASREDISNAFDIGHDSIVQTFLDSTTREAQELWGKSE